MGPVVEFLQSIVGFVTHGAEWEFVLGLAVIVCATAGLLVLFIRFLFARPRKPKKKRRRTPIVARDRVPERSQAEQVIDTPGLVERLLLTAEPTGIEIPGRPELVRDAVNAAAGEADAGDQRMTMALGCLADGDIVEAGRLFRVVAEHKTSRAVMCNREAAAAWRHLGAIVGLADPTQASLDYAKAFEFDPTGPKGQECPDLEDKEAAQIADARNGFERMLAIRKQEPSDWYSFCARMGIGDLLIHQGKPLESLQNYRDSRVIAERLHDADPGNANWRRDLSVSHDRIGDVLFDQGELSDALESYQASKAIRERLVEADSNNLEWRRDLALSHGRIAAVQAQQNQRDNALAAFRQGRNMIVALAEASPGNTAFPNDLAWFDTEIAALQPKVPVATVDYR